MNSNTFVSYEQPYSILFDLYRKQFLDTSVRKGLIDKDDLSLSDEVHLWLLPQGSANTASVTVPQKVSQITIVIVIFHSQIVISAEILLETVFIMVTIYTCFSMRNLLPDFHLKKIPLDSAYDAMPFYRYFKQEGITPFIDLNEKRGINQKYKGDFTIGKDGIPICKAGRKMNHDRKELAKNRLKYRCPLVSRKYGCSCKTLCSNRKYGRTVHLQMKDNPRLFNIPPRDST